MILRGTRDYRVSDYTIKEKTNGFQECLVELDSEHYYTFLSETGILRLIRDNVEIFVGVTDDICDFDFSKLTITIKLTDEIGIIKFSSDLLEKTGSNIITYTSESSQTILTDILDGTGYTIGYCPDQTIAKLEGSYLNRKEWLELLLENVYFGLDSSNNYTTVYSNIASEQTLCDVWVKNDKVYIGVAGTLRSNDASEIWNPKLTNITNYIQSIPELKENMRQYKKVIVIGNSNTIVGIAGSGVPVKVETDSKCTDATMAEERAKSILAEETKTQSITLDVDPDLFYSKIVEIGSWVIIDEPLYISGTYRIVELEVKPDSLSLTLDKPSLRFFKDYNNIKRKVEFDTRWI